MEPQATSRRQRLVNSEGSEEVSELCRNSRASMVASLGSMGKRQESRARPKASAQECLRNFSTDLHGIGLLLALKIKFHQLQLTIQLLS